MRRFVPASTVAILSAVAGTTLANSGTQVPLSQFQAGSETTSATMITNPGFEQPGSAGSVATGWTNTGAMSVGAPDPAHLPNPASAIGNFSAKAGNTNINNNEQYSQDIALAPNTDYVISGYIWNFALPGPNPPNDLFAGDLAVLQLRDTTNFFNTAGVILERTAFDGGDGANGYFVYKTFNSSQFPSLVTLEVQSDPNENLAGTRPTVMAQWDNIAITPVSQFSAQRWSSATGGNWGDNAKWQNNQANAPDALATFGAVNSGPISIALEAPKTVAAINFDSPNSYSIDGPSTLTLNHSEDRDANLLNAYQGSHTISVPITVVQPSNTGLTNFGPRNVKVTANPGAQLTISNDMVSSGTAAFNIVKEGAGTLRLKNARVARLTINDGTVGILPDGTTAGRSNVSTLTIAGGSTPTAKLDLTNNAMVVDYTSPNPSPISTIADQIRTAYASGAWTGNGITSSSANATSFAVGFAERSSLTTVPAIFGTVDADAVLVRYTRYGDANLDGSVNLDDFNLLASNFNTSGKLWSAGNFNYDAAGNVNLDDFNLLAGNFNLSAGADGVVDPEDWAALAAAIPEPSALLGGVVAFSALGARRRRGAPR